MSGRWRLSRAFVRMYRDDALVEQEMCCRYCRDPLTYRTSTVEHRVPRSRRGDSRRENIAASCQPCNAAKGSMTEAEFLAVLQSEPVGRSKAIRACWRRRTENLRREAEARRAGKTVASRSDPSHRSTDDPDFKRSSTDDHRR